MSGENIIRGIDLSGPEQKWDFIATIGTTGAADNLVHYSFVICKRKLIITNSGIMII